MSSQLHQVVRATAPIFVIILAAFLLGTRSSRAKIYSLVPVMIGVGFALVFAFSVRLHYLNIIQDAWRLCLLPLGLHFDTLRYFLGSAQDPPHQRISIATFFTPNTRVGQQESALATSMGVTSPAPASFGPSRSHVSIGLFSMYRLCSQSG
jgi:hypothetical protein